MRNCALQLIAAVVLGTSSQVYANSLTCAQFTALGTKAENADQVVNSDATKAQVAEYWKVIGSHAENLSFLGFSARAKALKQVRKTDMLASVMRETLGVTRVDCFIDPGKSFAVVALGNFDSLLDRVAKKLGY
jgi:hypothetical protein